jgi:hypothetical protein
MHPSLRTRIAGEAPSGSLEVEVTYKTGDRSSKNHLPILNPVLAPALACPTSRLFKGSLNLWADEAIILLQPSIAALGGPTDLSRHGHNRLPLKARTQLAKVKGEGAARVESCVAPGPALVRGGLIRLR